MIAVDRLTKEFGRTVAVRDVSFHAAAGEVVGLLGPNGSGKTTILRALAGFFPPTAGAVRVAGIDVGRDALRARARIGYLPENAVWYPDMRVREFLQFCAGVRGLRGRAGRDRLAAVRRDCGLDDVAHRLIGHLSKGYRQRVGLAQALLHDPDVLILDEPTVGLDPRQVIEMRRLIAARRGRTTVLLSTHMLAEASAVCDRVVIIDRGRVVAENSAEALAREAGGGERFALRVDGPGAAVAAALRAVAGVEQVAIEEPAARPLRLVVTVRADAGAPVRLAAAVVEGGWGLVELRPLAPSLEDLYVRLVANPERPAS